ncbi:MAG: T9SS type A sorting domain-containing protein, partial [Alteromonadales bacterium]|nr:T9SS type A sorting domain-containing protein [Alteromonadales bacterium]
GNVITAPAPVITGTATNSSCDGTVIYTYTYVDSCDTTLKTDWVYTYNIFDATSPQISGTLTSLTLEGCNSSIIPAPVSTVLEIENLAGNLAISDNCTDDVDLVVTSNDVENGTCPIVVTRTYTITDACGNKITQDATFTIVNSVKPDLNCPLDQYVDTGGASYYTMPDYFATGEATASDSCGDITTTQYPLPGSVQRVTVGDTPIIVTLSVTDSCGNFSICDFELSINLFSDDDITVTLYPNPSSYSSTIEFVARKSGDVTISISDLAGRIVQRDVITVIGGEVVKKVIDTSRLPSAIYIIHLTGSSFNKTLKLLKN